jgi:hypothetical protein
MVAFSIIGVVGDYSIWAGSSVRVLTRLPRFNGFSGFIPHRPRGT